MMPSDCTVDKFLRLGSMKIWERLIRGIKAEDKNGIFSQKLHPTHIIMLRVMP